MGKKKSARYYIKNRGISDVVAVVLIIFIVLAAIAATWAIIVPFIKGTIQSEVKSTELSKDKLKIFDVKFYNDGQEKMNLTIGRGATEFVNIETMMVNDTVIISGPVPVDIVLVIDLSGSMLENDSHLPGETTNVTRIVATKNASIDFIKKVLSENNLSRIAIVGFRVYLNSTNPVIENRDVHNLSKNFTSLKGEIDSWTINENHTTWQCKGMEKGLKMFDFEATERGKIMVILGDGEGVYPAYPLCYSLKGLPGYYATLNDTKMISIAKNFSENYNISVSIIGFGKSGGGNQLFKNMAIAGNGIFYNASNTSTLTQYFANISQSVTQNVTYEVTTAVPVGGLFLEAVIFTKGNSYSYIIQDALPGPNGVKRYTIPLADVDPGLNQSDITKIDIYLKSVYGGVEATSRLMSSWKIEN